MLCPADAPDNLFAPLAEHDMVSGSVGAHARSRSVYTALEMRPSLRRAMLVAGGAAVAALLLRRPAVPQNRRPEKRHPFL